MEAKIFNSVDNDDVEGLIILMDYPNIFEIEDASGLTILQKAISDGRVAVFDFLLSQDGYQINARNSRGTTALQVAHRICSKEWGEHCLYSLLRKGADIHFDYKKASMLHYALDYDYTEVAKLLIEKGADLNCQDIDGKTPLHMVHTFSGDKNEMLAMMLCFGADPSIPDYKGYKPIDFALRNKYLSEAMQEHFLFYFFDEFCTDYDIPLESLFDLFLNSDSTFVPQVLKQITSVNLDMHYVYGASFGPYFEKLFKIKLEHVQLLLEKFDYVIKSIMDECLNDRFNTYYFDERMSIENYDLLLQSQFNSDVIQIIKEISMYTFTTFPSLCLDEIFSRILFLLSYGANIYDTDLDQIYNTFGDCEFFRILLHMDIKVNNNGYEKPDIMPALLYNVHMDIETFLSDTRKYFCSVNSLEGLLSYFAHPKLLKKISCSRSPNVTKDIRARAKNLPSVPLLVELARTEVRKFLIRKHKIENSMQFYTLIKHLPISKVHQKIITLEIKLY